MLRQEQLAFIEGTRNVILYPLFLRQLRKAFATDKKKKALTGSKVGAARTSVLEGPSGFGGGGRNSRDSLQLHVS
jgi:hypothetical protein